MLILGLALGSISTIPCLNFLTVLQIANASRSGLQLHALRGKTGVHQSLGEQVAGARQQVEEYLKCLCLAIEVTHALLQTS